MLNVLSEFIPGHQSEQRLLEAAFDCGAIDCLCQGYGDKAARLMRDAGISVSNANLILRSYGFDAIDAAYNRDKTVTMPAFTPAPTSAPAPAPAPAPASVPDAVPMPKPVPSPPQQPAYNDDQPTPKRSGVFMPIMAIAAVAVILAIGFTVANMHVDSREESASIEESSNADVREYQGVSSPIWNLINGGHMASINEGEIVYADPVSGTDWDTKSIVRTNNYNGDKTVIYNAPDETINVYHLNILGNRVVFNQIIEDASTVVSASLDGADAFTLDSCDDYCLYQVHDGWVYYRKNGMLCRCDSEGNNKSTLCNVGTNTYWRVIGESLYYFNEGGDSSIRVSNLDGSNSTVVNSASSGYAIKNAYPLDNDHLVLLEKSTSSDDCLVRIYTISSKSSQILIPDTPNITRFCSYPDGVIATQRVSDNEYRILSSSYSDSSNEISTLKVENAEVRFTSYLEGMIMYGRIADRDCEVRGFNMRDGTDIYF